MKNVQQQQIVWTKTLVARQDKSKRKDPYYRIQGQEAPILRSLKGVKEYCDAMGWSHPKTFVDKHVEMVATDSTSSEEDMVDAEGSAGNLLPGELHHVILDVPRRFPDVKYMPDSQQWMESMQEEVATMHERQVWELVEQPSDKKVIGSTWVYVKKRNTKGEVVRYRSRLVAQGFGQVFGDTYEDVFAPVIDFAIIRLLFVLLVCFLGWCNTQIDVKCAYLYAPLQKTVYMRQPPGFAKKGMERLVCKLKRALYGLHQSGREWSDELNSKLLGLGLKTYNWCNGAYHLG
jgi:hypothetical protein